MAAEDAVGAVIEVGRRAGRVGDLGFALLFGDDCRACLERGAEELLAGMRGLGADEDAPAVEGAMEDLLGFFVGALLGSMAAAGGTLGFAVAIVE